MEPHDADMIEKSVYSGVENSIGLIVYSTIVHPWVFSLFNLRPYWLFTCGIHVTKHASYWKNAINIYCLSWVVPDGRVQHPYKSFQSTAIHLEPGVFSCWKRSFSFLKMDADTRYKMARMFFSKKLRPLNSRHSRLACPRIFWCLAKHHIAEDNVECKWTSACGTLYTLYYTDSYHGRRLWSYKSPQETSSLYLKTASNHSNHSTLLSFILASSPISKVQQAYRSTCISELCRSSWPPLSLRLPQLLRGALLPSTLLQRIILRLTPSLPASLDTPGLITSIAIASSSVLPGVSPFGRHVVPALHTVGKLGFVSLKRTCRVALTRGPQTSPKALAIPDPRVTTEDLRKTLW